MELVATRSTQLEPGLEQVHEPFGVAQFGGGHAIEVAVAKRFGDRRRRRAR